MFKRSFPSDVLDQQADLEDFELQDSKRCFVLCSLASINICKKLER